MASGVPGGIFTPMLLMGAALGSGWSHLFSAAAPDAGRYALMGMAAATAASIHAPVTAAVMIFELSGDYPIALPLIVAAVASTAVSKACGSESVYKQSCESADWDGISLLKGDRLDLTHSRNAATICEILPRPMVHRPMFHGRSS